MKTIKLTVLFKSGAEKVYWIHDMTAESIKIRIAYNKNSEIITLSEYIFIRHSEIASAEIEVIEQ